MTISNSDWEGGAPLTFGALTALGHGGRVWVVRQTASGDTTSQVDDVAAIASVIPPFSHGNYWWRSWAFMLMASGNMMRFSQSVRLPVSAGFDRDAEMCRDERFAFTMQLFQARFVGVCRSCGGPVEKARECYAIPTCYMCLPPPEPLDTARPYCTGHDRGDL